MWSTSVQAFVPWARQRFANRSSTPCELACSEEGGGGEGGGKGGETRKKRKKMRRKRMKEMEGEEKREEGEKKTTLAYTLVHILLL